MAQTQTTDLDTDNDTQFDHRIRIVSVPNLEALCDRSSGVCHRYWLDSVVGKYARVYYSNPDEYGHESPICALFPIIKYCRTIGVILTIDKVMYCPEDSEDWQAFEALTDSPELFRSRPDADDWRTKEEIEADKSD